LGKSAALPGVLPLVVVAGPTAVGKTGLGISLAERFDGEVVNADSRYLFRHLDIGVAKPSIEERRGVPHHLIDVLAPDETMTLARYQDLAMAAIAGIHGRGKLPILVGGTPLYVNAVVEGWRIPRVPPDPEFRAVHEAEVTAGNLSHLIERLERVDPVAAARSRTNPRRIIRALEIHHATGTPMSELEGKGPRPFRTLEFGLTMPRELLHRAIDKRVDDQIRRGLIEEVRSLLAAGVAEGSPAMSSLGYRQLLPFLHGEEDLNEAIRRIKVDTHRYVRHQETWLRKNPNLIPLDVTESGWQGRAATMVEAFLVMPRHLPPTPCRSAGKGGRGR
jgi:tRNA dimethylallyltransferase